MSYINVNDLDLMERARKLSKQSKVKIKARDDDDVMVSVIFDFEEHNFNYHCMHRDLPTFIEFCNCCLLGGTHKREFCHTKIKSRFYSWSHLTSF